MGKQNRSRTEPIGAKWKINSIGYGGKLLAIAGLFGIVLPLGLYVFAWTLDLYGVKNFIPLLMMKISLWAGVILAGLFCLLLAVEFLQDRMLNRHYDKNKKYKSPIADGRYECQYCGAWTVRETDTQCSVCGKELD